MNSRMTCMLAGEQKGWGSSVNPVCFSSSSQKKQEARRGDEAELRPQPLSAAARQPPKLNLAGTDNAAAAKAGAEAAAE